MARQMLFLSFLLAIAVMQGAHSRVVNFTVDSSGAGPRFFNEIGVDYSKQVLENATYFIWETFQQNNAADNYTQNVSEVSLHIISLQNRSPGEGNTYEWPFGFNNTDIYIDGEYIENFTIDDLKREITGHLYRQVTHVWQWYGNKSISQGLLTGIAYFVRLQAGYPRSDWVLPGQGTNWDQGKDVTAWFLDYLHGLRRGFVAELNKRLNTGYSDSYFIELLGKNVTDLWADFTTLHGNQP